MNYRASPSPSSKLSGTGSCHVICLHSNQHKQVCLLLWYGDYKKISVFPFKTIEIKHVLLELVTADHGSLAWVGTTSRLLSKCQNKHNHKCLSCTVSEPRSFSTTEEGLWEFEDACCLFFTEETFVHLPGKFPRDSVSGSSLYVSCRRIRAFAAPVSSSSVGKNWRWIVRFAIKPLH